MEVVNSLTHIFYVVVLGYGALSFLGILPGNKIAGIGFVLIGLGNLLSYDNVTMSAIDATYAGSSVALLSDTSPLNDAIDIGDSSSFDFWSACRLFFRFLPVVGLILIFYVFIKTKVLSKNIFALAGIGILILGIPLSVLFGGIISMLVPIFLYSSLALASFTGGEK